LTLFHSVHRGQKSTVHIQSLDVFSPSMTSTDLFQRRILHLLVMNTDGKFSPL